MPNTTQVRSFIPAGKVRAYACDDNTTGKTLELMGIGASRAGVNEWRSLRKQYGMDAAVPMITTPSTATPVQFLQYWIPEVIPIVTAAREIDDIVGRTIAGKWSDDQIVAKILERTGTAQPYGDDTNIPLSSWNTNFEYRDIVRFEQGCQVGILEQERASAMQIDSSEEKRTAAAEALAIEMNNVGFYGYNEGENRTYGFLNDPNLPNYVTVANGAAGTATWKTKTYNEICNDIRTAMSALRVQSGNLFKPERDACTISIAVSCMEYLTVQNELGNKSVYTWITETYPKARITSAIQLDGANGSANVFYVHADTLSGTRVVDQYVQEIFRMLGVEKKAKGFLEDYSNATAGIMVKQPVGIVRYSGI